jgi:hypothetical protein
MQLPHDKEEELKRRILRDIKILERNRLYFLVFTENVNYNAIHKSPLCDLFGRISSSIYESSCLKITSLISESSRKDDVSLKIFFLNDKNKLQNLKDLRKKHEKALEFLRKDRNKMVAHTTLDDVPDHNLSDIIDLIFDLVNFCDDFVGFEKNEREKRQNFENQSLSVFENLFGKYIEE